MLAPFDFLAADGSGQWTLIARTCDAEAVGAMWPHALEYPSAHRIRVVHGDKVIIEARRG